MSTPSTRPEVAQLRRLVLAVSVLEDIDVEPADGACVLTRPHPVEVPWADVRAAIGSHHPDSRPARVRLSAWLRLRARIADLGTDAAAALRQDARALALPPDHVSHPGPQWVQERLLGGALDCGAAVVGSRDDGLPEPLPPALAASAGVDASRWWGGLWQHAEDMGRLAVQRLVRDGRSGQQVLRPVGGVDVPTLLMSTAVRRHVATEDGSGMRALAVPVRSRGWFDLARIDPAFVGAAWSATSEEDRGVPVPLLVTADEVARAPVTPGVLEALRDPVRQVRWRREVRHR